MIVPDEKTNGLLPGGKRMIYELAVKTETGYARAPPFNNKRQDTYAKTLENRMPFVRTTNSGTHVAPCIGSRVQREGDKANNFRLT